MIPKGQFRGEVSLYNFLQAKRSFDWYKSLGKVSPISSLTIVNGNDWFCKHDHLTDAFFKKQIEELGIDVLYNTTVSKVDKSNQTMTLVSQNGDEAIKDFNAGYFLPTTKSDTLLTESGLATPESNNFLDVDAQTLRHKKYPNVFGLGDCANLPTTKTLWGGYHQLHVVANNVYRNCKGLPLNAKYNGYASAPIITDRNKLTWMEHTYDGPTSLN